MVLKPIIYVAFYDHMSGDNSGILPLPCEVFGVLYKEDKLAYYICSWVAAANCEDSNSECYCILKSAVVKLVQLGGRYDDTKRRNSEGTSILPKIKQSGKWNRRPESNLQHDDKGLFKRSHRGNKAGVARK